MKDSVGIWSWDIWEVGWVVVRYTHFPTVILICQTISINQICNCWNREFYLKVGCHAQYKNLSRFLYKLGFLLKSNLRPGNDPISVIYNTFGLSTKSHRKRNFTLARTDLQSERWTAERPDGYLIFRNPDNFDINRYLFRWFYSVIKNRW